MTGSPFEGVQLKIKWAYAKIHELNACIKSAFAGERCAPFCEVEPDSGRRVLKVRLVDPVSDDLLRIVAEHVYHLRSSLDQLAVVLARLNGATTTTGIYFPFAGDAAEFASAGTQRKTSKLNAADVELIWALKPYRGGDNALWGLSRLSNVDKHIELIPVANGPHSVTVTHVEFFAGTIGFGIGVGAIPGAVEPLNSGVTVADVGPDGTFGFTEQSQVQLEADVVFGDVEVFKGLSVTVTLFDLTQQIEKIVGKFVARYA